MGASATAKKAWRNVGLGKNNYSSRRSPRNRKLKGPIQPLIHPPKIFVFVNTILMNIELAATNVFMDTIFHEYYIS